jgi:hypothetical protein
LRHVLGLVVFLAASAAATAGICTRDPVTGDPRHEFQFLAGYSPQSATLIGTTNGVQFTAAGFEYSYRCWAWNPVLVAFTPGMMPVAVQQVPTLYPAFRGGQIVASHWVYGFGVTPIGFTVDFARRHAAYPFVEINGGIITSTEPIPVNVPDATALNFLVDFGGGLKWSPERRRYGLTFGYKFLHISNAFTTAVNPGVDNNVFYLGFSLFR